MIKLRQYQEIYTEQIESVFYRQIHFVAVVNDIDPIEVQDWKASKIQDEFKKCRDKIKVGGDYSDTIIIQGHELELIDFKHLKLGQYFDLESYVQKGFIHNLHLMASILYLKHEGGAMYEQKPEPFGDVNREYRSKYIAELPAEHILGAVQRYLPFRKKFFESYSVFEDPTEGIDPSELSEEELIEYEKVMQEAEKSKRTQNLRMLNVLTNNDSTKFEEVLNMNLFLAFNQFEYIRNNNK